MSGQVAAAPRDIVLLVDDSPDALGFLTDALEQSGFSALIATSGQAALNIAERITPISSCSTPSCLLWTVSRPAAA